MSRLLLTDRHAVGDVQRQLDGGAGVRDPGARPDRFCAVAGRAIVTSTTWAMAFPRINCCTTTATVLTATATVTLSLRACLFLCYATHHKSIGGRLLLLPQAARDGLALCHLSRQDTSRGVPSQGRNWSKVCVRVEGSRSLA